VTKAETSQFVRDWVRYRLTRRSTGPAGTGLLLGIVSGGRAVDLVLLRFKSRARAFDWMKHPPVWVPLPYRLL
jgi:hypothetical protein